MADNQPTENGKHVNDEQVETFNPEGIAKANKPTVPRSSPNNKADERSAVVALMGISSRSSVTTDTRSIGRSQSRDKN